MNAEPFALWRAMKFLVVGPMVLVMLVVINLMTSPHHLWVKWAALGIGIAWVIKFIRVLRAAIVLGGLAALVAYLTRRPSSPRVWPQ